MPNVKRYILNQEEHHKKMTFLEEYVQFLNKFDVGYDERYKFKALEYPLIETILNAKFYRSCLRHFIGVGFVSPGVKIPGCTIVHAYGISIVP